MCEKADRTPLGMSGLRPSGKKCDIPLKGFKVTISTKLDVSDQTINLLTKWCKKEAMHHIVVEYGKSGVKHVHALVCCEFPKIKRNIADHIWKKYVRDCNEGGNVQKHAVRVDVLYDNKWYLEYLRKEDHHEVISTNYDPERESNYYPEGGVKEQLEEIQASYTRNNFWTDLANEFKEWYLGKHHNVRPDHYGVEHVHEFYHTKMLVDRTLPDVADDRRRRQNVKYLWMLINQITLPGFEDRKYYASHNGPTMDFSG